MNYHKISRKEVSPGHIGNPQAALTDKMAGNNENLLSVGPATGGRSQYGRRAA